MATTTARRYRLGAPGGIIMIAAIVVAVILGAHILFVLLNANGANDIVHTDGIWAGWLATWFIGLFTPRSAKLGVFLNFGLAIVFYLVVGRILASLVEKL